MNKLVDRFPIFKQMLNLDLVPSSAELTINGYVYTADDTEDSDVLLMRRCINEAFDAEQFGITKQPDCCYRLWELDNMRVVQYLTINSKTFIYLWETEE